MENIKEIWKPVKEYENFYHVSNMGNIRSLNRIIITKAGIIKPLNGRLMSLTLKNNGYESVMFARFVACYKLRN